MAATATIRVAPEQWKEATITGIKLAQTVIDRADGNAEEARRSDPLPRLRDACVRESNNRIHEYARATRAVVVKLQQSLVATNEEIKLLIRARQGLEKSLDNLRKDLVLNAETVRLREERPIREKVSIVLIGNKLCLISPTYSVNYYLLLFTNNNYSGASRYCQ